MKELEHYSRDYIPNLKLQDSSKDCLGSLYNAAGKLYLGIDRRWNMVARQRYGDQISADMAGDVWIGGATADEIKGTLKAARRRSNNQVQ